MPCAIEYLDGGLKNLPLGYTVGLENNHLKRAREYLAGFPVYVWPCSLENEFKLLDGGFTGLTDNPDPNLTWLPSGNVRWFRPSSLPTSVQYDLLLSANEENHKDIVKQLKSEVTPWTELDRSGKVEILSQWRKKWSWEKSVDDLLASTSERSMPWESVRLIGTEVVERPHAHYIDFIQCDVGFVLLRYILVCRLGPFAITHLSPFIHN